jgi:hypothetical protein
MTRHNPEPAMETSWTIEAKPDRRGGGYLLTGANGGKVRVYGSRADVDLIVEAVNAYLDYRVALCEIARGPTWVEAQAVAQYALEFSECKTF